jgi:hypothetical protein
LGFAFLGAKGVKVMVGIVGGVRVAVEVAGDTVIVEVTTSVLEMTSVVPVLTVAISSVVVVDDVTVK